MRQRSIRDCGAAGRTRRPVGQPSASLTDQSGALLPALQASFSSTYLTLTSIVQGVTLGYLVIVVDEEMTRFEAAQWLLVVTTFLVIVATWHEYMMAVTVFSWIPGLRDSLIPFLLGGTELMLVRSLRRQTELEWSFLAAGFVAIVTLVAFVNMYRSAAAEDANEKLLVELRFFRWLNLAFIVFATAVLFSFSAVEAWVAASDPLDIALSATFLGLVLVFLVRGTLYWSRIIHFAKESAEAPP